MKKKQVLSASRIRQCALFGATVLCTTVLLGGSVYAGALDTVQDKLWESEQKSLERLEETGTAMDPNAYSDDGFVIPMSMDMVPQKFDLREEGWVTPVKFQNPWGACWGFAAIAASESSIISELGISPEQLDLSERQLAWFASSALPENSNYPSQAGEGVTVFEGNPLNTGGMMFTATSVFSSGIGPVSEEMVPYRGKNGETIGDFCYSPDDDWSVPEEYRFVQSIELQESNILPSPAGTNEDGSYYYNETGTNAIKKELMNGRAVSIGFCADTYSPSQEEAEPRYINTDTWAHYTDQKVPANHAVTIVGWDDMYQKENFLEGHQPEADGAWIVKNSWGAASNEFPHKNAWGDDGYFYLSYYDQSIVVPESFDFYVENLDTHEDHYMIDQYDLMPSSDVTTFGLDVPIGMANVFTASEDQVVRSLSAETAKPGTTVNYQVYLLDDDFGNPINGEKVADVQETYQYGGYHRIELQEGIPMAEGQKYSVVATLRQPEGSYGFFVDAGFSREVAEQYGVSYYTTGIVNPGESYLITQDDYVDWHNVVSGSTTLSYDNFAIKAYADPIDVPKLQMTQAVNNPKDTWYPGDVISYRVTFDNLGKCDISNIQLSCNLADLGEQSVIEGLAVGDSAIIEYTYTVTEEDAAKGTVISSVNAAIPDQAAFQPVTVNTSVNAAVRVHQLDKNAKAVWKDNKISVSWGKVKDAEGYEVYAAVCGNSYGKAVKSTTGSSAVVSTINGKRLNSGNSFKVKVRAYRVENGKKKYLETSSALHVVGSQHKTYTNPKAVTLSKKTMTLKKNQTAKLSAKITKQDTKKKLLPSSHIVPLRYWSTNEKVAKVSASGTVKGTGKGTCKIYAMGANGVKAAVTVTCK